MQKKNIKNVRLSKNIIPTEYEIQLKPDLENFTFSGIETIHIKILKDTKAITLHSKDLELDTADVLFQKNKIFAKISYHENETVTFSFPKVIPSGKIKLNIVFKGILNDKMRGFYKSKYKVGDKEYHLATTQFEATDARRAFPCFDEPSHKAIFHVSLIVPKGKNAISNTLPISVKEHEAGFEILKFSPTPKMSTYLLAFVIGDFEYLEKQSGKIRVRVYTTPGKKHQAKFALDVTVKVLEFYEKYFDIPYPLPTLDMIAIPDFTALAMENWGAITFREIALLFDEKNTSALSKELIVEVIAHELAHQWFGNLVTMEWWTHLWLNEGFASYIPFLVVEELFPEWDIWERFTTEKENIALRLDALANTHPIEVAVHHPDEIGEIFDAISYTKGASAIRMLADYLGKEDFKNGLRYYLKKHSYKNTETVHLWEAFEKVSKKPVAKIMKNWTSKSGYPVVKAEIVKNNLVLSQSRFFSSPISKKKSKDKTIWQIPVHITTNSETKKYFLNSTSQKILLSSVGKSWIKINPLESSFFRTVYSKELLEMLKIPVKEKILPSADRLGIIRDLFALSEAGVVPTIDVFEFLSNYKNEDNYIVWLEIATGLSKISKILAKESFTDKLDLFILDLFSPLLLKLSFEKKEKEKYTEGLLRPLVISILGQHGDKKVINEMKNKYKLIKNGEHLDPDIRESIYRVVAQTGGTKEYKELLTKYKKESLHEEKNRIGNVLGSFNDENILLSVCEFALSKDVRPQDSISILSVVAVNTQGRDVWWNFVKKNWKTLVSRYGEGGHTLSRAIQAFGTSAEENHFKDFKKFFSTHEAPGAQRAVEQVIERLESNIAWRKRDSKKIAEFLNKIY